MQAGGPEEMYLKTTGRPWRRGGPNKDTDVGKAQTVVQK